MCDWAAVAYCGGLFSGKNKSGKRQEEAIHFVVHEGFMKNQLPDILSGYTGYEDQFEARNVNFMWALNWSEFEYFVIKFLRCYLMVEKLDVVLVLVDDFFRSLECKCTTHWHLGVLDTFENRHGTFTFMKMVSCSDDALKHFTRGLTRSGTVIELVSSLSKSEKSVQMGNLGGTQWLSRKDSTRTSKTTSWWPLRANSPHLNIDFLGQCFTLLHEYWQELSQDWRAYQKQSKMRGCQSDMEVLSSPTWKRPTDSDKSSPQQLGRQTCRPNMRPTQTRW